MTYCFCSNCTFRSDGRSKSADSGLRLYISFMVMVMVMVLVLVAVDYPADSPADCPADVFFTIKKSLCLLLTEGVIYYFLACHRPGGYFLLIFKTMRSRISALHPDHSLLLSAGQFLSVRFPRYSIWNRSRFRHRFPLQFQRWTSSLVPLSVFRQQ